MTQNVNKAMWAGETSHRTQPAHSTCLQLRHWENQQWLSSLRQRLMWCFKTNKLTWYFKTNSHVVF